MTDINSPYDKALDVFEAVLTKPLEQTLNGPQQLARASSLAPSSGYRAAAISESEGLLARSTEGAYRRGVTALRIGLSTWGFGEFALVTEPVLRQLRQSTRMTAYLGVIEGKRCFVGPYSIGRGTGYVLPQSTYQLNTDPLWQDNGLADILLVSEGEFETRQRSMILEVGQRNKRRCVVGLLSAGFPEEAADLTSALIQAGALLRLAEA